MTRLLCMRLGTGQPGATLVTCILRDGLPRTQADMWSRVAEEALVPILSELAQLAERAKRASETTAKLTQDHRFLVTRGLGPFGVTGGRNPNRPPRAQCIR